MWFLPLLVVGVIALAAAGRSTRKPAPPSRQLPPPRLSGSPRSLVPPGPPGPISVLGEILRIGKSPPPTVILCAIAEAQAIGRNDLASDIVSAFVAPVVRHHQRARSRVARPAYGDYERGSCARARSPRYVDESEYHAPGACAPPLETTVIPPPPSPSVPVAPRTEDAAPVSASSASAAPPIAPVVAPSLVPPSSMPSSMDDEIIAMLNTDPARFMEMVSRAGTFPSVSAPTAAMAPIAPMPDAAPPPPAQEAADLQHAANQMRASVPGSPIPGVSDSAWRDFVARLSRESPQFSSSRHVGQYRQRRDRLAELGIDPAAISGSAQAQRAALDADLADAHRHATAGGLFSQHLGRSIVAPGQSESTCITLSGLLGVIQCAGIDGAVGWLERMGDRKRYPHTSQAFLRTNGAF